MQKGVAPATAGRCFLLDARLVLEGREAAAGKPRRSSRGETGEMIVGHLSVLTHGFLAGALELWQRAAPGIVVDCVEMDGATQEHAS